MIEGPRGRVVVATRLFPPEVAAAAFRLQRLAEAFTDEGYAVEVLTTSPPPGSAPPHDGQVTVSRWPALRDDNGYVRGYLQYLSFDVPLLLRLLTRRAADLYVSEPPPTTGLVVALVARLRRRPYVYYAADIWSDAAGSAGAPPWLVRALRTVESRVLRGAARVISVSDGVAERVAALGVAAARITTVGNGVDTAIFRPDGTHARQDADAPYVVYTGTMSEWQGADVFLDGLAVHRQRGHDTRAVFLGQGSELPRLRERAQRLTPGAVEFLGVRPPETAAEWIRGALASLVSVRPGLGYDFAKPTKIYAATACGTPVIFAGQGASRDLVRVHDLGWGVDHEPTAVADALDAAVAARGTTPRSDLVAWTESHASLTAVARRAVEASRGPLTGSPDGVH